ncbi:hypothetical protein [Klebsiella pneumoniae]|uniref:hypothetical protein n=1 Tax=Klebsiella pneumoniae TaxID=573 RepID=UPI00187BA412|nr:hypothetical protein [Klebsiella pneumoniae]
MKNRKISASLAELIDKAENSQRDIKTYVDKLDEYKSEFNFVLLSKAFSKLLQTKQEEYRKNHNTVAFFSALLVVIPVGALLNHLELYKVEFNFSALAYYLPILSLELLMFYFMRLYYIEGKAIKAQLLQNRGLVYVSLYMITWRLKTIQALKRNHGRYLKS